MCKDKSYFEAQSFLEALFPKRRYFWKGQWQKQLTKTAFAAAVKALCSLPESHAKGRFSGVAFENYFGHDFRPSHDTAFLHRPGISTYMCLVAGSWSDSECDESMTKWVRETYDELKADAVAHGEAISGSAPNFTEGEAVSQIFSVDVANRWTAVKDTWDPDNVFRFHVFEK